MAQLLRRTALMACDIVVSGRPSHDRQARGVARAGSPGGRNRSICLYYNNTQLPVWGMTTAWSHTARLLGWSASDDPSSGRWLSLAAQRTKNARRDIPWGWANVDPGRPVSATVRWNDYADGQARRRDTTVDTTPTAATTNAAPASQRAVSSDVEGGGADCAVTDGLGWSW